MSSELVRILSIFVWSIISEKTAIIEGDIIVNFFYELTQIRLKYFFRDSICLYSCAGSNLDGYVELSFKNFKTVGAQLRYTSIKI